MVEGGGGAGGLIITPRLAASGDIELRGWRSEQQLNPGKGGQWGGGWGDTGVGQRIGG